MSPFSDLPRGQSRDIARLKPSRELVLSALTSAFGKTLKSFDDMRFAHTEREAFLQVEFHDVLREVHLHRALVIGRFRQYLEQAWQALDLGEAMSADAAFNEPARSALHVSSEFNLQTRQLARDLVNAVTRDCSPLLAGLDRRLGLITGYARKPAHHPIGPARVFAAMHQALSICDFSSDTHWRMSILGMREMRPRLIEVYQSLAPMLGLADVASGTVNRSEMSRRGFQISREGDVPTWMAQLAARLGHNRSDEPVFDVAVQQLLLEGLSRLVRQSRDGREGSSVLGARLMPGRGQVNVPSLSTQKILAALTVLQTSPNQYKLKPLDSGRGTLAQRLKTEVINQLVQMGVASNAWFSSTDEDAIDLMCLLFQTLLEQHNLEIQSRGLIAKLVVPLVKVALLDRRVFVQTTHPARGLLDVVIEACLIDAGANAPERGLTIKVEEVVERLLVHFKDNPIIFCVFKDELRDLMTEHRRHIELAERRATELQRGHERLEAARAVVAAELGKRLEGRLLPQAIEDFLRQPWAHHLTMALLREGEGGPMAISALAVADGLLHELTQAQRQIVNVPWLQERRHGLIKVFSSVGMGGDAAGAAIDALRCTLEAVSMSRPELECALPELPPVAEPASRAAAAQFPGLEVERGSSTLDFNSSDVAYFRALPIGTWMDFVERGGEIQVGKLSWVSPVSSRLLFVDRRGERCCVASPEELAVMVRSGRLRPHRYEGAFDHAMQHVIDRLNDARQTNHFAS